MSNTSFIYNGNSINEDEKQKKYTNVLEGYNYIATKDVSFDRKINYNNGIRIPFNTQFRVAPNGNVLMCIEGGSAGRKIAILNEDVCFGNKLACFHNYYNISKYLFCYLQSPAFSQIFKGEISGIIGGVSINTLKSLFLPLPPLAEQQRIVEKIESMEPYLAEYDKIEKRLTKLESEIKDKLKKSILQYAIQGKLVKQNPNDEPASVLLERIKAEKEQLIKEGKIKRDKNESFIYKGDDKNYYENINGKVVNITEEIPFEIPDNWCWNKLKNISFITKLAGFEFTKFISPNLQMQGIPLFKGKNVQNDNIVYKFESFIPLEISNQLKRSQVSKKCLLTPYVGTIGNIAIHDKEGIFHLGSNVGKIELYNNRNINVLEEYVLYYLKSNTGYLELSKLKKATAQESISIDAIRETFIALPPKEEQSMIVKEIKNIKQIIG